MYVVICGETMKSRTSQRPIVECALAAKRMAEDECDSRTRRWRQTTKPRESALTEKSQMTASLRGGSGR